MNLRKNAVPKSYTAYFIEPGLADYTTEGIGVVLVQKDVLDRMMSTFVGMPVVNFEHTDKEPSELFNMSDDEKGEIADGVVSSCGYDEKSGWYYAQMMIWDKETQQNIDKNGYSVSCAYDVLKTDTTGGTIHNVPYDEEVTDGTYVHMAVVPNPRYEKAWIIKNSKSQEGSVKIKLFRKKPLQNEAPKPEPEVEEEIVENAESGVIELADGTQIPLAEAIELFKAKKAEELDNAGEVLSEEDEIEIDGEKVSVKELMAACKQSPVENAEPVQDVVAEDVVDETRQNSTPSRKVNKVVKNSAKRDETPIERKLNTVSSRLDRGKSRYGSKVEQGGK